MPRYIIRRPKGEDNPAPRVWLGVDWLELHGGGTVIVPGLSDVEEYFDQTRREVEHYLRLRHMRLDNYKRPLRPRGNVLAVQPDAIDLELVESCWDGEGSLVVVELMPRDSAAWLASHDVEEITTEG